MSKKNLIVSSIIGVVILIILFFVLSKPAQTDVESTDKTIGAQESTQVVEPENTIVSAPVTSYTAQEVTTHSKTTDCWTIVDDVIYDITEYIVDHPGGEIIATICGKDGTQEFKNQGAPKELADSVRRENNVPPDTEFHSPDARNILESYKIGTLETVTE